MDIKTKKALLDYIRTHDDGSDDAKSLTRKLTDELNYADCDVFSVSVSDLESLGNQTELRDVLGKQDNGPYTIADCERVANLIADHVSDEFGENLHNAILFNSLHI